MQYFISDQNAENGTHARKFHTMDEICLRVTETQNFRMIIAENHLPYKLFVALDLLFKVTEGRAGQNYA